jgi:hypothetical protein
MLGNCIFDVVVDLMFTKPVFKLPGTLAQSAHTVASRMISLQFTPMAPTLGLEKERDKEEE